MAKLAPGIYFSGTIGNINFYQVENRTYARTKSSLTRKMVLNNQEFASTRKFASDMGLASRIASIIYRAMPNDVKGRWIFRAIAGEAASLLYQGKEDQEVRNILREKYIENTGCASEEPKAPPQKSNQKVRSTKKINSLFKTIFLERWEKQGKPARYFNRAWKRGQQFNPDTIPRRSEYFLGFPGFGSS